MKLLSIESSCDETSSAVLEFNRDQVKVLSLATFSQAKIHRQYGGVVPEVAARNHCLNILPVIEKVVGRTDIEKIKAIAVTNRPGLMTSLMVGLETAKVLSYAWNKPLIAVNHLEGHIYAGMMNAEEDKKNEILHAPLQKNIFPAVCLIISGGHTELILMKAHGKYQLIGRTRDDASGECFDKCAKILGLPYPGGPAISCLAKAGNSDKHDLPRPLLSSPNFDFSFSGLKTAVLYLHRDLKEKAQISQTQLQNLCASIEQAIVDVLISKTLKAIEKFKPKSLIISGGVAANQRLRFQFQKAVKIGSDPSLQNLSLYLCPLSLCGDNAVMIGLAGYMHWLKNDFVSWKDVRAYPSEKLGLKIKS